MNNRIDPGALSPGQVVDAENVTFRHGIAETRPGVTKPACFNNLQPEISNEINPWTTIHGVGVFVSGGVEYVIIAADGKCHFSKQGNNPVELTMPTGLTLDDPVTFTPAFGKILMHRGKTTKPLVMSSLDDGFEDVVAIYDDSTTYAEAARVCWGPMVAVDSVTRDGTTVTVTTSTSHGYEIGQEVFVTGASESGYNGRWKISVGANADEFTYEITTTPTTPEPSPSAVQTSTHFNFFAAKASPDTPVAGEDPINDAGKWTQVYDAMPNSATGVYIQNRLAIPTGYNYVTGVYGNAVDTVVFSDILDITKTYWNQGFEIGKGGEDVVDIHVISENQLAAFKENSVHVFTGIQVETTNSTFATGVVLETLIPHYGLAAPRAKCTAGDDLYFFSAKRGVVSLKRNLQGKAMGVDLPISEPIQKLIERIDPRSYSKVRMEYHDNSLYVACALDGGDSGENNCLLVHDFLSGGWSYYTGTSIRPKEFFIAKWSGRDRLWFWGGDGFVNLVDEGFATDHVRDTGSSNNIGEESIAFNLRTRGYTSDDLDHRKFQTLRINLATWNPQYNIKLIPDGVNEGVNIATDRTKDRTKYYRPFDALDFDEETAADFDTPYREDYSARVGTSVDAAELLLEDGETILQEDGGLVYTEEGLIYFGQSLGEGFYPFKHQEILESYSLPVRLGRYGQVEVSGSQGRLEVKEVTLTSVSGDRSTIVHA
tara:strand:- start:645 stop:2780 length:2136 start_codon:yes stop_codon:yes gene_type:complete